MVSIRIEQKRDDAVERPAGVVTLADRKRFRIDEIRAGIRALRQELARYGRAHGGTFWLFGSAANGRVHYDSDIDILVDFGEAQTAAALAFAEGACIRLRLRPDISPKSWCTPAFIDRIKPTALVLP